jgi:hypothetical protein
MIFDHGSRPRDRSRDTGRVNCRATRVLRGFNQRSALTQVQGVRPVFEIESGVGRKPNNCSVRRSQLGVRAFAGSHDAVLTDHVVQRSWARRARRMQQLHTIIYSRDARFAGRISGIQPVQKQDCERCQRENIKSLIQETSLVRCAF